MSTEKAQFIPQIYTCNICIYVCSKKSDWNRHVSTHKHKINNNQQKINKKSTEYICICGKQYKERSGLWRHKKKCIDIINTPSAETAETAETAGNKSDTYKIINIKDKMKNEINDIKNDGMKDVKTMTKLVLEVIKSNNELQKQNSELHKQNQDFQKHVLNICQGSNNTINSNNKTFNLQVFLNEDCKDAMNLTDFVKSIQVQLSDLESMGTLGYTEGISKIIISEMNDLEQTKRPVHCSDIKRETLYVKDEDKWEKEEPNHSKLKYAIRNIEQKNFVLMSEWQAEHPNYKESTSEENNEFLKLVSQTVNGTPENINKVIKKIAKEVVITKGRFM